MRVECRLVTYGDWVALIGEADRCDAGVAELLRNGRFERDAQERVFELVRGYCGRCCNREASRLERLLRTLDPCDAEGIATLCRRFSRECSRLLFFEVVEGFPVREGALLADELRDYVSTTLRTLARDLRSLGAEDAAYGVKEVERRWVGN